MTHKLMPLANPARFSALRRLSHKSEMAKACRYGRKRWVALTHFLDDGRLEIDNNIAERAMCCLAHGCKSWRFTRSKAGGDLETAIYCVIETAKLNGLEPQRSSGAASVLLE